MVRVHLRILLNLTDFFKIQNHGKTDLSIEANLLEQIY